MTTKDKNGDRGTESPGAYRIRERMGKLGSERKDEGFAVREPGRTERYSSSRYSALNRQTGRDGNDAGHYYSRDYDRNNISKLETDPEKSADEVNEDPESLQKHAGFRFISFLVLFLIVVLLAGMAYLKSKGVEIGELSLTQALKEIFSGDYSAKTGSTVFIPYDNKKELLLGASRDTIIKYSDEAIIGMDKQGEEKWKVPAYYNDPLGVTADSYAAVADLRGKRVQVFKGKSKVWELETENSITALSINQNGYTALVRGADTARSAVTVYDPNGTEIFTKTYAKRYVLNAEVKPDNREVLISLADISGVSMVSGFEVVDIFGSLKAGITPLKQGFYPYSWFFGETAIAVAEDESVALYNRDGSEIWTAGFRRVYSAVVVQDAYLAAAVSKGSDTRAHLEIYDLNGCRFTSEEFGDGIVNIRSFEEIIAVNTGRELIFMNTEGKLLGRYSPTADITDMYFLNRRDIAVITRNSINIFDLGVVR